MCSRLTVFITTMACFWLPYVMANSTTQVTQTELSQQNSLNVAAKEWTLTLEEYQRYETLKQGQRGIFSPGLDPITTLGIEARSADERRHFAELFVKQEFQRVEKELAFQREVDLAWKRLFPTILPISDVAASPVLSKRLALFVKQSCAACDIPLNKLLASEQPFDIYLVDSQGNDEIVRQWARTHNIPIDKIKNGHITLNHDQGLWRQYGQGKMPVVLQLGEKTWQIITY